MFTKHVLKFEMFVAFCWSYGKWCISIGRSSVPLVDHFVVKVWIQALPNKSTPGYIEIFSDLKG